MALVFVVGIHDQDAQVLARLDRLLDQDRNGGRLADAGRSEDGEVPPHHLADADRRRDFLVLAEMADLDAVVAAERVDRRQVGGADEVGDRAERRVRLQTASKAGLAVGVVGDFAGELHPDMDDIGLGVVPSTLGGGQRADDADDPHVAVDDGDEMADRPVNAVAAGPHAAGDHRVQAVELDELAENPAGADVAPVLERHDVDLGGGIGVLVQPRGQGAEALVHCQFLMS